MNEQLVATPMNDQGGTKEQPPHAQLREWRAWGLVIVSALAWWVAWNLLQPLAEWITFTLLGLSPVSALGSSIAFFLYDVPKILLLLTGMIFLVTTIRTFFSAERTRQLLGGKRQGIGNVRRISSPGTSLPL